MKIRGCILATVVFAVAFPACSSKKKDDIPPPFDPPPASATTSATTPVQVVPTATTTNIVPIGLPGQSPSTLAEAILHTRPQMADSVGAPDAGSVALGRYWAEKKYPWAQLEAVTATTPVALLTSTDAERGKRLCEGGMVQQFASTGAAPNNQYEALLATKEGTLLSIGAVGDATGIKQGAAAKFCGIASGVQTIATPDGKQSKALRLTGYFDTPANHGGGGGGQFASLRACCQALSQNAASMPPPQGMYALAAANYCHGSVAAISSPQQKDAMVSTLRGMLKGAALPAACR